MERTPASFLIALRLALFWNNKINLTSIPFDSREVLGERIVVGVEFIYMMLMLMLLFLLCPLCLGRFVGMCEDNRNKEAPRLGRPDAFGKARNIFVNGEQAMWIKEKSGQWRLDASSYSDLATLQLCILRLLTTGLQLTEEIAFAPCHSSHRPLTS